VRTGAGRRPDGHPDARHGRTGGDPPGARPGTGHVRVLILTTFDLDDYVYEATRAGASGFLVEDVAPADLAHGVRTIAAGDALLAPSVVRRLLEQFVSRPPLAKLGLRDRIQAVILAYESGLVQPGGR
jgi:DNA-binding NarL/FixJ family response regulator